MSTTSTVPGSGRHRSARAGRLASASAAVKVLCGFCALLSISLFVITGYAWYNYNSLNQGVQRLHLNNLGGEAKPTTTTKHGVTGTTQNILITGIDSRSGLSKKEQKLLHVGSADSMSTDTIILVHVPAGGAKATMISIPRDSYVDIPGYRKNKINGAYADGYTDAPANSTTLERENAGADLLIAAVKKLTGQDVDHYIQIGFGGFYKIAQAINGIDVNLCHAVDDTAARNRAEGQIAGSGFKMSAGEHHLNAVESLEFVRQRHNLPGIGDDLGREKRQQYFITAAFHKASGLGILFNPSQLSSLIAAIKGSFFIDDTVKSLPDLASQLVDLNSNNITSKTIPTSGGATIGGGVGDVITVDPDKVRAFVTATIDGPAAASSSPAPAPTNASAAPTSTPAGSASAAKKSSCIN